MSVFFNSLFISRAKHTPQAQNMSIYCANNSDKKLQKNNIPDDLVDYKYLGLSLRCIKKYILNKLSLTEKFVLDETPVVSAVDVVVPPEVLAHNNKSIVVAEEETTPAKLTTPPHTHTYFTRSKFNNNNKIIILYNFIYFF